MRNELGHHLRGPALEEETDRDNDIAEDHKRKTLFRFDLSVVEVFHLIVNQSRVALRDMARNPNSTTETKMIANQNVQRHPLA